MNKRLKKCISYLLVSMTVAASSLGAGAVSLAAPADSDEYSQMFQTLVIQSITTSMNASTWENQDDIQIANDGTGEADPDPAAVDPNTPADPAVTADPNAADPAVTTAPTAEPTPEPTADPEQVAPAAPKDEILSTALKPGTTSAEVKLLQKRLMTLQFFESDDATGYYGSVTTNAVKFFQRANGLTIDGVAGQETLQVMFSDQAKKYTIQPGDSGTDVASLQRRLKELNYFTGNATGYYGTASVTAIKEFQKANGLTVDGKVGIRTRDVLYSSEAKAKKVAATPKPSATAKPSSTKKPSTTKKPSSTAKTSNPTPNASGVQKLLQVAQAQLGKKYVAGNEGPSSFDCSGFVYYCLKNSGINIGRLSARGYSGVSSWTSVSKSNLKAGDLLFFSIRGGSTVGHVGIYMGNNRMIHCSSSKGQVVITSITTSYWVDNYISAKRVF